MTCGTKTLLQQNYTVSNGDPPTQADLYNSRKAVVVISIVKLRNVLSNMHCYTD